MKLWRTYSWKFNQIWNSLGKKKKPTDLFNPNWPFPVEQWSYPCTLNGKAAPLSTPTPMTWSQQAIPHSASIKSSRTPFVPPYRHSSLQPTLPYPLPMLSCLSATWAPYLYIQAASLFQEFPCDITTSKTSDFSGSKCSLHVDGCISCKFLVQFISVCHILVMSYHHSNNWSLGLLVKKLSPSLAVQIT